MNRIVQATAAMTFHGSIGDESAHAFNRRLQGAMIAAIERCQAQGIHDPEALRQAQHEARVAVLNGR